MSKLVAITHSDEVVMVTDYRAENKGSRMNPEIYLTEVEVDGKWMSVDTFKEVTFKKIEQ
jgi:hypothetical protein